MKQFMSVATLVVPMLIGGTLAAEFKEDYEGCYKSVPKSYKDMGSFTWQSQGNCQGECSKIDMPLMALYKGKICLCGDEWPSADGETKDDNCKKTCDGYKEEYCGGSSAYGIFYSGEGVVPDKPKKDDKNSKTSSSSSSTKTTPTKPTEVTTTKKGGETVVITASSSETSEPKKDKGTNTAGIAAGVVVGVVGVAAIIGGVFFFLKYRKRKEVVEEYRRNATISSFVSGGKPYSEGSASDSRLDPSMMSQRRQSNGSIADDQDFSRRILQVTNPDGHY